MSSLLLFSCSVMSDSLQPYVLWPARLLCPWDVPSKNTGVGCHCLLQGIISTQGSNLQSLSSPAVAGGFFTTALPGKPNIAYITGKPVGEI